MRSEASSAAKEGKRADGATRKQTAPPFVHAAALCSLRRPLFKPPPLVHTCVWPSLTLASLDQIDDEILPLLPPLLSYSKSYSADTVRDVSVTFLLDSWLLPNMPILISVIPTIFASTVTSANIQLGVLAVVFGAFIIFGLLQCLNKGSAAMSTLMSRRGEIQSCFLAIFFNSLDPLSD